MPSTIPIETHPGRLCCRAYGSLQQLWGQLDVKAAQVRLGHVGMNRWEAKISVPSETSEPGASEI
jgi:hypothetical protein